MLGSLGRYRLLPIFAVSCLVSALGTPLCCADDDRAAKVAFFERKIRPVLTEHCLSCHSSEAKIVRGGLLLDSQHGLRAGGDSGAVVHPGDPSGSLLMAALRHETLEMPPDRRLSDAVIADFENWIRAGAVDPRTNATAIASRMDPAASRDHWAFAALQAPTVPADVDPGWVRNPIDAFVWRQLNAQDWRPAGRADKQTLIRRATFDLIGLPPTEQEIQAFIRDDSPASFARVVDRLLASPQYGERWGRHWLDLVRYADTNGADENHQMPNAWRYRDWVIHALNQDLPLDEFMIQQLAGDLLPVPDDEQQAGDLLTATGMLVIGPKMLAEQDKEKMRIDIIDEQIDTVSRTFLGMTIACARCHDHKFDPIAAADYYAMAGIFASTRTMQHEEFVSKWLERPLPSKRIDRELEEHQRKLEQARKHHAELINLAKQALVAEQQLTELPKQPEAEFPESTRQKIAEAKQAVDSLEKSRPAHQTVMAVEEQHAIDLPIHIRGNHLRQGPATIPRGAPARLTQVVPYPPIAADHSGRLELARWFTAPNHPLTARVMANRIWMWHFGQPLMKAPSNFGLQSDQPVHSELLDWLATRLIRDGWSLKRMHRLIMLSNTYQMTSRSKSYLQQDPNNEFLWRQNRRRLEVEPLRDAILSVGGSLIREFGGPAIAEEQPRRTVYIAINRAALSETLATFDYVEPANHIEQRPVTTVPGQALFLLNNPVVHQQAARLVNDLIAAEPRPADRVSRLYLRLCGRQPRPAEVERVLKFVDDAKTLLAGDENTKERMAWTSLCRTLIAGSQFCYVE